MGSHPRALVRAALLVLIVLFAALSVACAKAPASWLGFGGFVTGFVGGFMSFSELMRVWSA